LQFDVAEDVLGGEPLLQHALSELLGLLRGKTSWPPAWPFLVLDVHQHLQHVQELADD